jgi:hypothetical protein
VQKKKENSLSKLINFMRYFNEEKYLDANPDVKEAVNRGDYLNGRDHYKKFGEKENRSFEKINPNPGTSSNTFVECLPGVPLIESPFFKEFAKDVFDEETLAIAKELNNKGYVKIKLNDDEIDSLIDGIKNDFEGKYDWNAWKNNSLDSLRIQDAWKFDDRVKKIALNEKILLILKKLYGREPVPFQTLNFAVGTQQAFHTDQVHFSSIPEKFMCGVWVAFEDVDKNNGPLMYYPESHKWPFFYNENLGVSPLDTSHYPNYIKIWETLAKVYGAKPEYFYAKKGEALIWLSNLMHGGSPVIDKNRTRWSQVTHYFFENCVYTTPLINELGSGKVYFRDITNIKTNKLVKNILSGRVINKNIMDILK